MPSSARACPIDSAPEPRFVRTSCGKLEQPDVVGNRRAILPDGVGDLLLRQMEVVGEAAIACASSIGFRSSRWMFSMSATASSWSSGNVANDDRDLEQAGALRRAPAPFAGDDLVAALDAADDDRLDDAVGADGSREILDLARRPSRARLKRVGPQQIGVDVEARGPRTSGRGASRE